MHRQRILLTGLVRDPLELQVLPDRSGSRWPSYLYALRSRLLENLDRLYSNDNAPTGESAVLKAMLLGDDNWLDGATEKAFQNSGTYHVLVVSGWNVWALALPLLWVASRLRVPQWLGTLLVASAVVGFALLAQGGASVARAALMFLLFLVARLFYRQNALLNSTAAAALILLLLHPSDLRDSGFQLSFFAVLVLGAIALPLVEWTVLPYRRALQHLEDREQDRLLRPNQLQFRQDMRVLLDYLCPPSRDPRQLSHWLRAGLSHSGVTLLWLAEGVLFTLVVQAGFTLLMSGSFHRVTWSGLFANLLILPLASAIVLIGMPVLLLSLVWWPLASGLGVVLGGITLALQSVASWAAQFSSLNLRVPAPPVWLWLSFLILLIATAVLVGRRSRWVWAPSAALGMLCVVLTIAPYAPRTASGRLELTVLDVGQGDSLFVTFPQGQTMLIDAGGAIPVPGSPPPRFDVGEDVVSSYLWSRNIQRLDYVVLTHDHVDHYRGMKSVLANFPVGEFWIGPDPGDRDMEWLRAEAQRAGARIVHPQEGERRAIGGVQVAVLSPPPGWAPKRVGNDDSIVLRLSYGARHILLPGDVEARMERHLLQEDLPLASEILKVAHHGSKTSSTPAFLERAAPRFGIISVGAFSRFGHPHAETLEALRVAGVRTYRTDQDGAVTASTDGNRLELTAFRDSLHPWPRFVP